MYIIILLSQCNDFLIIILVIDYSAHRTSIVAIFQIARTYHTVFEYAEIYSWIRARRVAVFTFCHVHFFQDYFQ